MCKFFEHASNSNQARTHTLFYIHFYFPFICVILVQKMCSLSFFCCFHFSAFDICIESQSNGINQASEYLNISQSCPKSIIIILFGLYSFFRSSFYSVCFKSLSLSWLNFFGQKWNEPVCVFFSLVMVASFGFICFSFTSRMFQHRVFPAVPFLCVSWFFHTVWFFPSYFHL